MYHICPAHGQAHLLNGERGENSRFSASFTAYRRKLAVELVAATFRGIGAVDKCYGLSSFDYRLNLGKTRADKPRLIGQGQSILGPVLQCEIDLYCEIASGPNRSLEALDEDARFGRRSHDGLVTS
jgi:hypothetical protein